MSLIRESDHPILEKNKVEEKKKRLSYEEGYLEAILTAPKDTCIHVIL